MSLPPDYDRWTRELLGSSVGHESVAPCSSCAMCDGGGTGERPMSRFRFQPNIKCCTYIPMLPNFRVGAILVDEGPYADLAREQMRLRLQSPGREVNPLWVGTSAEREGLDSSLTGMTGMHTQQRCVHLLNTDQPGGTTCAIWKHRESVCSTWWCRYDRGHRGLSFWWSLRYLFRTIEYALGMWACLEDEIDPDALYLLLGILGQRPDARAGAEYTREQIWGGHAGSEEAFYIRCHERVKDLTWAQVLEIGGPSVEAHARHVVANRDRLTPQLPERVVLGQHTVTGRSADGMMVETYSPYDPVLITPALIPLLHLFDGRPLTEIREQFNQEHGIVFDDDYLQHLVDFNLLVQVSAG